MPDYRTMPIPVLARHVLALEPDDQDRVLRQVGRDKRRQLVRFLEKELGKAQVRAARERLADGRG